MVKKKKLPDFVMDAFYRNRFKDSFFIVKAGGQLVDDQEALSNLLRNIRELTFNGTKVLLVFGGGTVTDRELENRGIEVRKHQGRRITDEKTLEVMKEILGGRLSLKVSAAMAAEGLEGLSLNAVPADWMHVELRPKEPVDFGLVGDIREVSKRAVMRPFRVVNFIACACLATTREGITCNINADTVATELAIGTEAHKLVFLSDVDGVIVEGRVASTLTDSDIPVLIENGTARGGMRVKLENCLRALNAGVRRIHLLNGFRKDALLKEIFEPVGPGTMVLRQSEKERYLNEIKMEKR